MSCTNSCIWLPLDGGVSGGLENFVVPGRMPGVHLSQEEIQGLRFKPTIGTIQCSEGSEIMFNCSIDLTDKGHDLNILWFKDGKEIFDGTQTSVYSHGTVILLSIIRFEHQNLVYNLEK